MKHFFCEFKSCPQGFFFFWFTRIIWKQLSKKSYFHCFLETVNMYRVGKAILKNHNDLHTQPKQLLYYYLPQFPCTDYPVQSTMKLQHRFSVCLSAGIINRRHLWPGWYFSLLNLDPRQKLTKLLCEATINWKHNSCVLS